MNATDVKYLSTSIVSSHEETDNRRGRPPNKRYPLQSQHPQAKTHVLMNYSEPRVPILYGPQISRQDRVDTRERYYRALLKLFVPCRTVNDLCDVSQTWENAFQSQRDRISVDSWKIVENIQLLHECRKDRDEHLLQVITEAQTDDSEIDLVLLPSDHNFDDEGDNTDDNEVLSELLNNIHEYTTTAMNVSKRTTEDQYVQEAIEAVEKVGRFSISNNSNINSVPSSASNELINSMNQQFTPFVIATKSLVHLNKKWQEQLKTEKERARQALITGSSDTHDNSLDTQVVEHTTVTVLNPSNDNNHKTNLGSIGGSILPVMSVAANLPTQKTIADEFTLNREQVAFVVPTHFTLDCGRQIYCLRVLLMRRINLATSRTMKR
ncbi:unnamed protein product [Adineta ricciae]|uniref:Uncharacterized protein n=1 Tax=Adineta ricciae TaxID=249248 RepID=A0A815VRZ7_ADIRI|nr:unnamed protein product [Adineta ricciae]CAF1538755.1 unnamed protein product [Adineta ricciae]